MDRVANLLGALSLRLTDEMHQATEDAAGRGAAAPAALIVLSRQRARSLAYLRQALGLSQPATVRVVDRLGEDGLVRRSPGPDRRTVTPVLTAAGERAAARAAAARTRVLVDRIAALDDAERDSLAALLEKLLYSEPHSPTDATRLCRLCDVDTCEQHPRSCPVDLGVDHRRGRPRGDRVR